MPHHSRTPGAEGARPAGSFAPVQPRTPAPAQRGVHPLDEFVPVETTGMRSRRLASERARAVRLRRWRRVRAALVLVLVLGFVGTAGWFAVTTILPGASSVVESDDYPGPGHGEVEVTVEPGEAGAAIGEKLVDAGVVKTLDAFVRAFEANKAATSIRPGTFTLKLEMSASGAVAALLDEANRTDRAVTVIPGTTLDQVLTRIEEVTDFTKDDLDAAMSDPSALGLPAAAGGILEGWLEPGSYEVAPGETAADLLSAMVEARVDHLRSLGVDESQWGAVVIKASIVQREVGTDEYYAKVARVIDNRLADTSGETNGLLGMDSTVAYAVGKTTGTLTSEDLAVDSPYNTHIHAGLPPGPISIPSDEAIAAVLHPADGDWLYFVTVNFDTGETLFAHTLAEHQANTEKLHEYCSANPGKC